MASRKRNVRDKITWTEGMTTDLLNCKKEAQDTVKGYNPPLKPNGRKMGYMEYMYKLWMAKGYGDLGLTPQNLTDKASHVELKRKQFQDSLPQTILQDVDVINSENVINGGNVINPESEINRENVINNGSHCNNRLRETNTQDVDSELHIEKEKLDKLITESARVYDDISCTYGDMSNRVFRTKFSKAPLIEEIKYIDVTCKALIDKYNIRFLENTLLALWNVNCVVYSAVAAWINVNNLKGMSNDTTSKKKQLLKSKCIANIDDEIKNTRAYLSQCDAEFKRLQTHGRLTRRSRRNRLKMQKDCDVISLYSLTCLIAKLKKRLVYLARKRKRSIKSEKAKKINNEFRKDQKKVIGKFKKFIEKDPENLGPVFRETVDERKYFTDPKAVEVFWRGLWEAKDVGDTSVPWIREIKDIFSNIVPHTHEGDLDVTPEVCWNAIKKKKNWSSAGPDYICNFWWKKLTSVHEVCRDIFSVLINEEKGIEGWFCRGRTPLLEKPGEWSIQNQRPITCLNTLYKWLTSVLLKFLNTHLNQYNIMQIDQRGSKEGTSGTFNNILIDDMISRDAALHKRNVFYYWIDVKKAFDSVSHSWLMEMLKIHRVPVKLLKMIKNIIGKWNLVLEIPVKEGNVQTKLISLTNGILQGDSLCPSLYTLSKNVISWLIRSFEGYKLSTPICEKVTHSLFIDDLKGYAKTKERLIFTLKVVKEAMQNAGLIWNLKKCRYLEINRGTFIEGEPITLGETVIVPSLKEGETYKFMGVPQYSKNDVDNLQEKLLKMIKQRANIVWTSELSDLHKVIACNTFVNGSVEYFFWTLKMNINVLKEFDSSIRNVMNKSGAKHTNLMNSLLYLPRNKGGRGLKSLETSYKETKIKIALRLLCDEDKRMKLVRKFHEIHLDSSSYSILKDAKRYSNEFGLTLKITGDQFVLQYNDANGERIETDEIKTVNKVIVSKRNQKYHLEICSSQWQGVNYKSRIEDQNVIKDYFTWLTKWVTCPTSIVTEFFLTFYQLLATKCFLSTRSKEVVDKKCRMCKGNEESVKHVISNCPAIVSTGYKRRHDSALKCFIFPMLKFFGLIEKIPPWYSNQKVTPFMENEKVRFWWDIPEYNGKEEEEEDKRRRFRPDGKIMLERDDGKFIFLIEITIPWTENRVNRYEFKSSKYNDVMTNLKLDHSEYTIDQITLVMDVFGGYGEDLRKNIGKVLNTRSLQDTVIKNMQKSVISSLSNISRTFKVKTK